MLLDSDYMLVDLGDMETQGETSNADTRVESNGVLPPPPMTPTATQDQTEADDVSNEFLQVGRKGKLTSPCRNHFKKIRVNGEWKADCNYCHKKLSASSNSGTKHLNDHYKRCLYRPVSDIRQHILVEEQNKADGTQSSFLSNYTFNEDTSRQNLVEMIIVHEIPCRNTVKSDILKIYDYEKQKTMRLFGKIKSRIAITTDMWTANHQKKGFMAITAHFIDQNWNLQSRIMSFVYVPCPHTADVLADMLYDCLCDWNLDRKLSTITVDNCTTNDAIINNLLDKLPLSSLMMNGELFHMRCVAHILNLIVQDGLAVIGDGINRIRDIVAFWTATPKREQKFEETTRQLEISSTKQLTLYCKTRWNSTYLMLSGAVLYKDVFKRLKARDSQYKCLPKERDWELAMEVCDRLQVFYEITLTFSGSKYPTANLFFVLVCEIGYCLREWASSSVEVIKKMASKMLEKFNKYWSVISGVMGMAAVLDPRYKMKFLELLLPKIYGQEKAIKEVQDAGCSASSSSGPRAGFKFFFQTLLQLPANMMIQVTNGSKYPTLQRIAKDILAIPVSTVASESAFSTSGRLISHVRKDPEGEEHPISSHLSP
ncbi:zinc finger BED domain-containing protein RICESLEEPER 2-like protein [Tanacetum coccineum]